MIIYRNSIASLAAYGKRSIIKVYYGLRLVYESFIGCFTKGYWINKKGWTNNRGWKN